MIFYQTTLRPPTHTHTQKRPYFFAPFPKGSLSVVWWMSYNLVDLRVDDDDVDDLDDDDDGTTASV